MSLEQIKNFRQLGSITAGHPEYEPLDVPDGCEPSEIIIDAIIKMGKDAGDLHAICKRNKIPHVFETWR